MIDSASTLPPGWQGENHCSDIQWGSDGRFAYGANRGHDSIAVLAVDPASGAIRPAEHVPCGGRTPRNLAVDPSGTVLIVANQNSDRLTCFAIDAETGALRRTGDIDIGSPMCVAFLTQACRKPLALTVR